MNKIKSIVNQKISNNNGDNNKINNYINSFINNDVFQIIIEKEKKYIMRHYF